MSAENAARALIRMALGEAEMSQADLARSRGLSQKHVSQMLTGHCGITLYSLESLLAACGIRLVLSYIPRKSTAEES